MQLGLLAAPLKQLSSLQELVVRLANLRLSEDIYEWEDHFAILCEDDSVEVREATATSANDRDSCEAVAQVIVSLTDLRMVRLCGLPTAFIASIETKLEECDSRVALEDVID